MAPTEWPLQPGSVIASRYEILSSVGAGGMGFVFRAHDRVLDEEVAIKILRSEPSAELVRRFREEVKLARRIRHRNVCAIHDYGEDGGLLYISMEMVEGTDLKRLLARGGGLLWEEGYDVSLQLAEGLAAIHEAGVIHRDLKPANAMRDAQGVVRVMDFGIAKRQGEARSDVTGSGEVLGSPEYMSPEQVRGAPLDFRSDLYSLGLIVFELFTGRAPFRGQTPMATMLAHLQEPAPLDAPDIALSIPAALLPVLAKALAKSPDDRFRTSREMRDALQRASRLLPRQSTDVLRAPVAASGPDEDSTGPLLSPASLPAVPYPPEARLLIPALLRALAHPDADVRIGAAEALARTPDASARLPLETALQDPDAGVRERARAALDKLAP